MKKILTISFFVLISGYALFQGRYLILGPRISLETPLEESVFEEGTILAKGIAKNTTSLSVNDHKIFTDPKGNFEKKLIVHRGINIIKFVAEDRFGREEERLVRIVGN